MVGSPLGLLLHSLWKSKSSVPPLGKEKFQSVTAYERLDVFFEDLCALVHRNHQSYKSSLWSKVLSAIETLCAIMGCLRILDNGNLTLVVRLLQACHVVFTEGTCHESWCSWPWRLTSIWNEKHINLALCNLKPRGEDCNIRGCAQNGTANQGGWEFWLWDS